MATRQAMGNARRAGGIETAGLDLFAWSQQKTAKPVVVAPPRNPFLPSAEPPQEAGWIRAVLQQRRCPQDAITAPRIAEAAGLWPDQSQAARGVKVRELIATWYESMLVPGCVLVSSERGYWHTDDPEALAHYDRSLQSRIREIALRLRRVRLAARTAGYTHHGKGRWTE